MLKRIYNSLKLARILALFGVAFWLMLASLTIIGLNTRIAENTRKSCPDIVHLVILDGSGEYRIVSLSNDDVLTDDLKRDTVAANCDLDGAKKSLVTLSAQSYNDFKQNIIISFPIYVLFSFVAVLHWAHLEYRYRQKKKNKKVKTYFKASKN